MVSDGAAQTAEAVSDHEALLELNNGTTQVPVFFTLRRIEGAVVGYLRLAHGHGNFVNRLLGSVGHHGRLILEDRRPRPITILSSEPGEAPGYLCAFALVEG